MQQPTIQHTSQHSAQRLADAAELRVAAALEVRRQLRQRGNILAAALLEAQEPAHVDRLLKRQARIGLILAVQEAELANRPRRANRLAQAYMMLRRVAA